MQSSAGEEIAELNEGEVGEDLDVKLVLEPKDNTLHEVKDADNVVASVQEGEHALIGGLWQYVERVGFFSIGNSRKWGRRVVCVPSCSQDLRRPRT